MRVVSGQEMAAIDSQAIEGFGLPAAALMERAGFESAKVMAARIDRLRSARVYVLCGGGNNGGDGFVAARYLANWGARVKVFTAVPVDRIKGDASVFYRVVAKMGVPIKNIAEGDVKKLGYALRTADGVVDALVGTGLKGPLRPLQSRLVDAVNRVSCPVVAVDIPSGVQGESGSVEGSAVRADATVTFGLPKWGHLIYPGKECTGTLYIRDIGFPRSLLEREDVGALWVREPVAVRWLQPRPPDGHKGTFGRLVVVGGSRGMAGAPALALKGALRAGVGLAVWAGPASILSEIQHLVPEATAIPLPEREGALDSKRALDVLLERLKEGDVVAVGPGLGTEDGTAETVLRFVQQASVAVVIDADGLNCLARFGPEAARSFSSQSPRVFTPHPKEAARLLGTRVEELLKDRLGALRQLVDAWRSTFLLKGHPTIVRDLQGAVYVNGAGDVTLATGGSGDVLTGVVGSLMAQGYGPSKATAMGAYLHGRAGEMAGEELGVRGAVASDVARWVAHALRKLDQVREAEQASL